MLGCLGCEKSVFVANVYKIRKTNVMQYCYYASKTITSLTCAEFISVSEYKKH